MNYILSKLPDFAPDGPLNTQRKGLLSPIADPLGHVVEKPLKPTVGRVVGAVGNSNGQALLDVQADAKEKMTTTEKSDSKKSDKDLPGGERIGGKAQTAQNPLGL